MLLLNKKHLHLAVEKIARYYKTNILGLYLGATPTIILTSTAKVKESYFERSFDGKPDLVLARIREPNLNLRGKCEARCVDPTNENTKKKFH